MLFHLPVYLYGHYVGLLSRPHPAKPFTVFFSYDERYAGPPLSLSLPVAEKNFDEDISYAFFENLLPEDNLLKEIVRQRHIAGSDLLSCLAELGKETAGAIILTDDAVPPVNDNAYRDCGKEIAQFLQAENGYMAVALKTRLSLAGAQDKLACVVTDNSILVPTGYAPTTHILKPDSKLYPDLIFNEYFCLHLAERIGIPVVKQKILQIEDKFLLSLERYDRYWENGVIRRCHQEDFCQAMGVYSSGKYQNAGLYEGYSAMAKAVPVPLYRQLTDFALLNLLIGNCDNHAKNLSIVYDSDGGMHISPMYDLTCTEIYEGLDTDLAIAIGRSYNKRTLTRKDLEIFAEDIGTTGDYVCERFYEMKNLIEEVYKDISQEVASQFGDRKVFHKIVDNISGNLQLASAILGRRKSVWKV